MQFPCCDHTCTGLKFINNGIVLNVRNNTKCNDLFNDLFNKVVIDRPIVTFISIYMYNKNQQKQDASLM